MNPKDPQQAPLKKYRKNLEDMVEQLKSTGAYLIISTTTPYPNPLDVPLRQPGEPQKYNEAALKIMNKYGVAINDLYTFVKPQMEALMRKSNVHFTDGGSEALAKEVVKSIKVEVMKNP
jgi:lysophospholipase L1-like esterase